jgi:GT2 family glycosyltransferase
VTPFTAHDLTVVIPTRDRWSILRKTLAALDRQTTQGFETVVVVDGVDQDPPDLGATTFVKERGGPGAARNAGVERTSRSLVLFLGDDMIPMRTLVERHIAAHCREPTSRTAVLGHAKWHPRVGWSRLAHWLDWSSSQFDYRTISGDDAGWPRFYSSNVSLKRELFLDAGGFDEDFMFDYEDLDFGWRLHQAGMVLRYEKGAVARHLHRYDFARLERRYVGRAQGEQLMMSKHSWFSPFFAERISYAAAQPPVSRLWTWIVELVPRSATRYRRAAEHRANLWYHQRLAPAFMSEWEHRHSGRGSR